MAKINMVFDTDTKEFSVSADGSAIENVMCVSLYKYKEFDGDWDVRISITSEEDLNSGLHQCTTLYASKRDGRVESKKLPGLFEKAQSSVSKAVSALFKSK